MWTPGRRTSLVAAVVAPLLALVALLGWALASPPGSSPDDDFHLVSLWCERPQAGVCEPGDEPGTHLVASDITREATCHAFRPEESAGCQGDGLTTFDDDVLLETTRGNFDGLYPPVFYAVVSVVVGDDLEAGVLGVRVLNSLIFVGLLTAVVLAVPRRLRTPTVLGVVVTFVPLGMFVVPSTNPSSWALLSAATLWPAVLGFVGSRGRRALVLGALALLAVVVGAGARADAAVFAIGALVVVMILTVRPVRPRPWQLAVPGAVAVIALLLYRTASQGTQVGTGLPNEAADARPLTELLVVNVVQVPRLWVGMLGEWGLGWLDTAMPATTWVLSSAVFAAVVLWGLGVCGVRKGIATLGVLGAMWVVPVVLLVQTRAVVGEHVQPRYILPLAVILAGVAVLPDRGVAPRLSVAQAVALGGSLSLANVLALHATIRRYVTGTDAQGWNLDRGAEWWWSSAPGPMATWLIGSLAFVGALAALAVLGAAPGGPLAVTGQQGTGESAAEAAGEPVEDAGGNDVPQAPAAAPVGRATAPRATTD